MIDSSHPSRPKIKILLLAANPSDSTRLRIDEEFRAIDRSLQEAKFRDSFELDLHLAVQHSDLAGLLLRHQPDIVHFSGHGNAINEIVLEDEQGNSHAVSTRALSNLFRELRDNIRCVVLNACYSEDQAEAISQHIDVVIGMSSAISDVASIQFAQAFYLALGHGRTLGNAFEIGCAQIELSNSDEYDIPYLVAKHVSPTTISFVTQHLANVSTVQWVDPTVNSFEVRVALDATLYTSASIIAAPDQLIGREEVISTIDTLFAQGKGILLTGLGGIGKTALAAAYANRHLSEHKGAVIWMRCGSEETTTLLEAIFLQVQKCGILVRISELQAVRGDAKLKAVRDLLERSPIKLIVLDDIRNAVSLRDLQKAIPGTICLLATSRTHFANISRVEIGNLSGREALELLAISADNNTLQHEPAALNLCKMLGYHPYALGIAGTILNVDEKTPEQLLKRIGTEPHALSNTDDEVILGSMAQTGIKQLLDDSFTALDAKAQEIFTSFGTLFAPGATTELLSLNSGRTTDYVEAALDQLVRRSLAKRRANSDYITIHDLTFSYAHSRAKEAKLEKRNLVQAIERFVQQNAHEFDRLAWEYPNILGAVSVATPRSKLQIIAILTIGGYPSPQLPSYFDVNGHTVEFLLRLDETIELLKTEDATNSEALHYLLCKRGNAYTDRANPDKAIEVYLSALVIAPDESRNAMLHAVCGRVFATKGEFDTAELYLRKGNEIAIRAQDDRALAYVLEQQGYVAGHLRNDFVLAQRYATEAVETNRRLHDEVALGFALINLGAAELDLALAKARTYYQEAQALATTSQADDLLAGAFDALGESYHARFDYQNAKYSFLQAIELYRQLGKVDEEAELRNLVSNYHYLENINA